MLNQNKIIPLVGNSLLIDGGAMFAHVPKVMWQKWINVDTQNRIRVTCRAMLIQDQNKTILLEAGSGVFLEPKWQERYGMESENVLLASLEQYGVKPEDIDIVIISHMHFDHIGGLVTRYDPDPDKMQLQFPNAHYLVSKKQWQRATHPHPCDHASFVPLINARLENSNKLHLVDSDTSPLIGNGFKFRFSDGHTPGLLMTEINTEDGQIIFVSDLIPGTPWLHLPITTSYDRYPEQASDEKKSLLNEIIDTNTRLFYVHDNNYTMSHVSRDDKGRFVAMNSIPNGDEKF